MKRDKYGVVINTKENCKSIAKIVLENGSILISWTDGLGSQLDILFTLLFYPPIGNPQGGIQSNYLFISIMRMGAFGFGVEDAKTTGGYYSEKLGIKSGATANKLADLINGVRKELSKK